jgi:CSLREA domain-containing protein
MTRNRFGQRGTRLRLEPLEDRTVPSTFTVTTTLDDVTPANGKLSLREAITAANGHAGADVIVLPVGVFKITQSGAGEDANATGDFDITSPVTIAGAGAAASIIDARQQDRVFDVLGTGPSSIKAVLAGMTIRNGNVADSGGGIRVGDADLVVRDCAVVGNRASANGGGISNATSFGTENVKLVRTTVGRNVAGQEGGGLSVGTGLSDAESVLTLKDCTVRRNSAAILGGGISASSATLTHCTISGNTILSKTVTSAIGFGGGILADTATLTNCTISGNAGRFGGGVRASTATLTNCTVSGNFAIEDGGGISAATLILTSCTVSGNTAVSGSGPISRGGGIIAGTATLTNCTVSGNSATSETSQGGGIFATDAALINCTIVENSAHAGGGLFHNPGGTFSVQNTIVALNLTDFTGAGPDVAGDPFTSQGHNLIGNGAGPTGFTNGDNGDIVGGSTNPIDPKLGPLQNNGGATMTMALKAASPAIDHGDNAGAAATDQRGFGFLRKKDGNFDGLAIVDIGAFER